MAAAAVIAARQGVSKVQHICRPRAKVAESESDMSHLRRISRKSATMAKTRIIYRMDSISMFTFYCMPLSLEIELR